MENETSNAQTKYQGPLQLLSHPFLITSTTKQMRQNGGGGRWCHIRKKLNTHWTLMETSDMHDVTSENTTYYYYIVQVTHPLAI